MPATPEDCFQPGWGMKNPHLQTLWAPLLRRPPRPSRWRERFTLSDGDFVDVDWAGPTHGPIVLILHGLTGSSNSIYVLALQQRLSEQGVRSAALNFRGCSGEPNELPRLYHSGDTQDAHEVLQAIRQRHPHTRIGAAGYSLGGNVLLKWLGEQGEQPAFQAAVAVSVPFTLSLSSERMNEGASRIYRQHMLGELKRSLSEKKRRYQQHRASDRLATLDALGDHRRHRTFRDFDHHVVAPLHGFASADDYYHRSSSRHYLANITTPTLILHSADDPVCKPASVPTLAELSPSTTLELSQYGGHVGFVAGTPWRPRYWLDTRVSEFLIKHLKRVTPDQQSL